ncbi:hypothetical protein ACLBWS_15405 [Brucellaceae bacterium D45D]
MSGFAPQNITLISNTSSALVQIAMGLPSGSRVIAGGYQFPANVWPWRNACAMGRVKTRFIGGLDPLAGNWAGIEDSLDIKKPCHQPQPQPGAF